MVTWCSSAVKNTGNTETRSAWARDVGKAVAMLWLEAVTAGEGATCLSRAACAWGLREGQHPCCLVECLGWALDPLLFLCTLIDMAVCLTSQLQCLELFECRCVYNCHSVLQQELTLKSKMMSCLSGLFLRISFVKWLDEWEKQCLQRILITWMGRRYLLRLLEVWKYCLLYEGWTRPLAGQLLGCLTQCLLLLTWMDLWNGGSWGQEGILQIIFFFCMGNRGGY